MRRLGTIAAVVSAAALASAQPPTGPLAGEQVALFQRNRGLLESLVERAVEQAAANDPVARTRACHHTATDLTRVLEDAAAGTDPDRVAELSDYLSAVLADGLTPSFQSAWPAVPVGSRDAEELTRLHEDATAAADHAGQSIPHVGKVGQSARVADARRKLADAARKLSDARRP